MILRRIMALIEFTANFKLLVLILCLSLTLPSKSSIKDFSDWQLLVNIKWITKLFETSGV